MCLDGEEEDGGMQETRGRSASGGLSLPAATTAATAAAT